MPSIHFSGVYHLGPYRFYDRHSGSLLSQPTQSAHAFQGHDDAYLPLIERQPATLVLNNQGRLIVITDDHQGNHLAQYVAEELAQTDEESKVDIQTRFLTEHAPQRVFTKLMIDKAIYRHPDKTPLMDRQATVRYTPKGIR